MTLKALKSRNNVSEPESLGEHIRLHRLKLGLTQRQAAKVVVVNPWTILNWEQGYMEPPTAKLALILQWLGYNPFPPPKTLKEGMLAARRTTGWTIAEAARAVGVDPSTWGEWERTDRVARKQDRLRLQRLLQRVLGDRRD